MITDSRRHYNPDGEARITVDVDEEEAPPPAYSERAPPLQRTFTDRAVSGGGSLRLMNAAPGGGSSEQLLQQERLRMAQNFDPRVFVAKVVFWSAVLIVTVAMLVYTEIIDAQCDQNLTLWLAIYALLLLGLILTIVVNFYRYSMRRQVNQTQSFLSTFFFIWWIFGQVWVFRADKSECDTALWGTVLALVCLEYVRTCFPCILLALLCCCMPCIMPFLNVVGMPGADKKEINKLPTSKYEVDTEKPDDQCVVCLEEFKTGEEIRTLPCDHYFHSPCIDQWLQLNRTCPLCRKDIGDQLAADTGAGARGQPAAEQQGGV